MSQVSRDISNLPNSLHGDSQLEQSSLIAPGERQSETPSSPVHESSALLLDQDRTLNVPNTWNPTDEERERDHQKEEVLHSSYAGGKARHSKDKTQQSSANGQCTGNDSLQSSANEQLTEDGSIHRSGDQWKERPAKDGTLQNSRAEGKERPTEEEAQQLKSNGKESYFSNTPENSVRMSSADPITCQPHAKSLLPRLMTGMPSDCAPLLQKGSVVISEPGRAKPGAANGVMAPGIPTAIKSQKPQGKLQSHPSLNSQTSKRSKGSSKSSISQVQSAAQEDCCAHCILACLFCEFLMLCNIALDCATCGSCSSDESCFCCCCCSGECGDCDVPCDMDCGIVDACCESADCLEICMECCGLCFSS